MKRERWPHTRGEEILENEELWEIEKETEFD